MRKTRGGWGERDIFPPPLALAQAINYRVNNTIVRLTKLDQDRKSTPSFIKCSSMVFIEPTVNNEIDMQPFKNPKIYCEERRRREK